MCDPGESPCGCPTDCGPPPGLELSCTDGLDDDCDGLVDCADPDCVTSPGCTGPVCGDGVCDPGESPCGCPADCGPPPGLELSCTDGLDDDCDGLVDCADPDCAGDPSCSEPICGDGVCAPTESPCMCPADCGPPPTVELSCTDGLDDDCDRLFDCADPDCAGDPACSGPVCGDGVCDPAEDMCSCSADCGAPDPFVFSQVLSAASVLEMHWPEPADVRWVKGPLGSVSAYVVSGSGDLLGGTALDVSMDNPGPGSGLFYVVRPLRCDGSWQTSLGAEPERDATLP